MTSPSKGGATARGLNVGEVRRLFVIMSAQRFDTERHDKVMLTIGCRKRVL
jgi:hypothetical protein